MRARYPFRRPDAEVIAMRTMWREGHSILAVARAFGLHKTIAHQILTGYTYADVPGAITPAERRERYGVHGPKPLVRGGAW